MRIKTRREEKDEQEALQPRFVYLGAGYFLDRKTGRVVGM